MNQPAITELSALNHRVNIIALISLLLPILNPITPVYSASAEVENLSKTDLRNRTDLVFKSTPGSRLNGIAKEPRKIKGVITAYTSTHDQTDGDPFTTASGQRVRDGIVAANGLPFGTIIKIPSLFGDKRFIVQDRMNSRYGYGRFDVWFNTPRRDALKFGAKRATVEIYLPDKELAVK